MDYRVLGRVGLDDSPALVAASAGPADHLSQQREGVLIAAVIVEIQHTVGVEHAHQSHVGEIEPLCDHLGTDEDIILAVCEGAQLLLVRRARHSGIGIHTQYPRAGEDLGYLDLRALCAGAG